MDSQKFLERCKELVYQYKLLSEAELSLNNIFVVWSCKTLQNNKALLSTTGSDGIYYEITYNGDKDECYFDAYRKMENICIKDFSKE